MKTPAISSVQQGRLLAQNLLRRAPGFRDCSASLLAELVSGGQVQEFAKGQCIARWNDPSGWIGVLVKGSLESIRMRPDGQRHLLALLMPGDVVGIVSAVDGLGHVHDLWTRSSATLYLFPKRCFVGCGKKIARV